jgi:hypothetical protein
MRLVLNSKRRFANGTSLLETLVSLTLLTTTMSVFVPMVVRHARLLTAEREYRLALDELSNQLERLTALPPADLPAEMGRLSPSEYAAAHLHGVKLTGELLPAEFGQRLTLRIVWDEPQRSAAPLSLAAWILPQRPAPAEPARTEGKP